MFEQTSGFDLNDNERTRLIRAPMPDEQQYKENEPQEGHELDSEENQHLHSRLLGYHQRELDRQYANRLEQAIDEDYYDNDQWSEEEKAEMHERGQAPICWNVIQQTVNWVIGSEKRGRTDFNVLPRGKEDAKPAERKTALMKYLADVNRTQFHRSRAFEDAVKVGVGWIEDGVTDEDEGEPIYSRYESWRNMLWDSASTEYDLSDCRYVIRFKFVDLDIAQAIFPDRAELLERSANAEQRYAWHDINGDEASDNAETERELAGRGMYASAVVRRRVRMIEIWYTQPTKVQKLIGGRHQGEVYDPEHPGHADEVARYGKQVLAERMSMRVHVAIMTSKGLVYNEESPYRHNRFPFTPVWGYRRGKNNLPYGMIRSMRDIQDDINKRASRAQFILASNRVIMESGAVKDMDAFMEEIGRPDAIIELENGNKRFEISNDRELAASHIELMSRGISMIQQVSGVTDEQMGRTTNAKSGVAIQARQEQGAMSTSKLFDNLRFANQVQGEKQVSLIEQYMTEQKQFRITNQRGTPEYVDINDGLPENDIVRSKADFIITDAEWRTSLRQAQAEQLMEMMTRLPPQVALVMLDLVVESMDLPNRDELVKRIRQVSGQRDPDATELTPEEQAAQQAAAQQQQFQQQMAEAELRGKVAKAVRDEMAAERERAGIANQNVQTQQAAVNTAQIAMQAPGLLPVADGIMAEAGFVSATDQARQQQAMAEQQAAEQAAQQQAMQQAQQMQQQGADGAVPQQPAPDGANQLPQQ